MNKEEIQLLISEDLKKNLNKLIDPEIVRNGLIEPIIQLYVDLADDSINYYLWTVYEEEEDHSGYKIVFDPVSRKFGLGIVTDKDELKFLALYGSFVESLESI